MQILYSRYGSLTRGSETAFICTRVWLLALIQNPAVLELRSLFANLQLSNEPFINPSSLIDLLGLSHHVQQDSLEFSKLLMSLVEPELYSDNQLIIPNEVIETNSVSRRV
jgi:hypothetical protein